MARGISLTFQVLVKSKNQATVGLLDSAFQSTHEMIRKFAGEILISRRSGRGLETIIRNFDSTNPNMVELVNNNREKLIPGLHGAIVDKDSILARQAFRLAYSQQFYEVLPTLASFCLGPGGQDGAGQTLIGDFLKFLDKFTAALDRNAPAEHQLLFNHVLPEFSKILIQKIKNFRFTRHELTLTVYLRLYPFFAEAGVDRDLYLQLRLDNSQVYAAAYRRLLKESDTYLFRFITRCMDRLNPPPLVYQVVAGRVDPPFLNALFKSIKQPLTLEYKSNLAKIPPLTWISQIDYFLHQLDEESQCGLILFMQNITLEQGETLRKPLLSVFEHGVGKGRAAALAALSAFSGEDMDRLVWDAAGDKDVAVQVEALNQLVQRNVSGASSRIIQFAESPHEEVRKAIKSLFPNFRFDRFIHMFDQMDDEQRCRMFDIVRKLDKQTPVELSKFLSAGGHVQKTKALLCVGYCPDIVPHLEDTLCETLLRDEDASIRCKAAKFLAAGHQDFSRDSLIQALHRDPSPEVRESAKESLKNRPIDWKKA